MYSTFLWAQNPYFGYSGKKACYPRARVKKEAPYFCMLQMNIYIAFHNRRSYSPTRAQEIVIVNVTDVSAWNEESFSMN